ncbi:MAG: hypothetical protein ACOZAA_14240, partial [Pseudomonadota bacterium]
YKIFERPEVSLIPASQQFRMLLIAGVSLMALGAGLAAALILTWMQKSFSQSAELQTAFGLPVLGALSEVRSVAVLDERRRDIRRLAGAAAALAAAAAFYIYWEVVRLPAVSFDGAATASLESELAVRTAEAR